jgi:hypothetical protein
MITIASVSFKVRTFDSVEGTALSILRVVVPASAVVRILKWKIAIGPERHRPLPSIGPEGYSRFKATGDLAGYESDAAPQMSRQP